MKRDLFLSPSIPKCLGGMLVVVLLTLGSTSELQARRWTDSQGNTMEAEFVRVSGKTVYFNQAGKEVGVEMSRLSDKDQRFIRRLIRQKTADQAKSPQRATLIAKRSWTDDQGNQTEAKFVRVYNDNVVLLRGGRTISLPFWKLSEADQQYVAKIQEERGLEVPPAQAPAPPKRPGTAAGNGGAGVPAGGGVPGGGMGGMAGGGMAGGGVPGGGMPDMGMGGGGMIPRRGFSRAGSLPGIPNVNSIRERMQQQMEESRQRAMSRARSRPSMNRLADNSFNPASPLGTPEINQPQLNQQPPGGNPNFSNRGSQFSQPSNDLAQQSNDLLARARENQQAASRRAEASMDQMMKNMVGGAGNSPATNSRSGPGLPFSSNRGQETKMCSSCRKAVSSHLGAGDSCPHCGTYFSFEEKSDGSRSYAGRRGLLFGGGIAGVAAIIGVLFRMIIVWLRS